MIGAARKTPGDLLDYDIDFSKWLIEDDQLIDASATSSGALEIVSTEIFGQLVKVWLSGGEAGISYVVMVVATTGAGRVKEVQFNIRVAEC